MQTKWSGTAGLILLVLAASMALGENREPIGTIITTQGLVTARAANGESRPLTRRSPLLAGDTVLVGTRGFASLRMVDNAHLSLGADTEFTFDEYRYDANPATPDSVGMSLVRGCFRAVIGTAGANRKDTNRINTPLARITVAGAYHAGALVRDRLYTGTWDGATVVANARGSLQLGSYGDHAYSRTNPGSAPEGLWGLPSELSCEAPKSLDRELGDD